MKRHLPLVLCLGFAFVSTACTATGANNPLPSWNDGAPKQAIMQFVQDVTTVSGSKFVSPAERIAVFDNDGTLWAEQPMYFQLAFAKTAMRSKEISKR